MRAMVLEAAGRPLVQRPSPHPQPSEAQVLIRVSRVRRVPHRPARRRRRAAAAEAAARARARDRRRRRRRGRGATRFAVGDRVGVPWLGWTCGVCAFCRSGRENLCDRARFTGYDLDGGYAELAVADERFCFPLPAAYSDVAGGAADVRGADRLPRAAHGGRRARASASTVSARPRTSSSRWRATRGARCTRSRAPGDDGVGALRPRAGRRVGGRLGRARAGAARRRDHLRARRARWCPPRCAQRRQGRVVVCARHPHERHPVVPVRAACGASASSARWRTSRAATPRTSSRSRRACPSRRRRGRYPLAEANAALDDLARGRFEGAAVLVP